MIDVSRHPDHSRAMSIETSMTRVPRAFDAALGATTRDAVPDLSKPLGELIAGTAGSSPYLNGLILSQADWLASALETPEATLQRERAALKDTAPDALPSALRQAKARHALLIALADLSGSWSVDQVTRVLTEFADVATDLALKAALLPLIRRGKLPGQTEDDLETAAGLTVLAMGKMGAFELNYSSDIDLICLFDETRYDPDDFFEARQNLVKATRNMCAMLSDRTADGYVFRTDLRLRPDPSVTPVVIAMEAAERYYESLGRTWERAAYIKARPCAGDLTAGARFLKTLTPFVWRKHLDFAAIEDAHDMRLRIRDHKGLVGPITVPGHDMKLGRGGIREIEFFTQTRQLISGGRDPDLRVTRTWQGLATLADKGWVPSDVARVLIDHYRAHREVEHRIQMVHDAQSHVFPTTSDGIARIACLMDQDAEALQADIKARLTEVHELTEGFFAPSSAGQTKELPGDAPELDQNLIARWLTYPAFRSERARTLFDRLRPELLSRVAQTPKPGETLAALDGFLKGLPAGVQIFSLFQANHRLLDLLVDIAGTSPALASYLSRNASVFDAVIGGDFFADWQNGSFLRDALSERLAQEDDYEAKLDSARAWAKDWHFRIGVHHLRGLIEKGSVGTYYTSLADAVIQALWPVVSEEFARKHGPPPGRGAVIVGMGSLGSWRMTATSDVDMLVIYDPGEDEYSDGPRPLAARAYFARLTQAMITALSAPMSQGRLYEVDMRLRPSGNQGPVATSLASFKTYQREQAWVWEHMALTRARVIAGPADLAKDIEAFRKTFLSRPQEAKTVLAAVADMRARIAEAKSPDGVWDAKTGRGRLQDIDLLAQATCLISGKGTREVPGSLASGRIPKLLSVEEITSLAGAYWLYLEVLFAARLLTQGAVSDAALGEGGIAFLARASSCETAEDLRARLEDSYERVAHIIDAIIEREVGP